MKPIVFFSMSNGWGIRNFVNTGIFAAVSEFAEIVVAASHSQHSYFQKLEANGSISKLIFLPKEESRFWRIVRQSKKGILQAKHGISTAKIKSSVSASNPLTRSIRMAGWRVAGLVAGRWQIDLIEAFERRFKLIDQPSLEHPPCVLVTCEPFDNRDIQLQRTMHKIGVPSITIIPSWDNPSTKGCILTDAGIYLVWGEQQKEELLNFYPGLDPSRVRISGIPQFDSYFNRQVANFERSQFLSLLKIPENRKVILYATCSEKLFPTEPLVVSDVADAISEGRLGEDAHLLIRCHPADRASRYEHLRSSGRVTIFPSSLKAKHNLAEWIPPGDEVDILAATLRSCDLCINTASTITLDALACGKPVVNVGYDGKPCTYLKSVLRYYDYFHLRPIALSGAVPIVKSAIELVKESKKALENPAIYQKERNSVLERFCPRPDQGSVTFIVDEIRNFCQKSPIYAVRSSLPNVLQR